MQTIDEQIKALKQCERDLQKEINHQPDTTLRQALHRQKEGVTAAIETLQTIKELLLNQKALSSLL